MNRRGFLKTLGAALVVAAAPGLVTARTLEEAEEASTRTYFHGGWMNPRDDLFYDVADLHKNLLDAMLKDLCFSQPVWLMAYPGQVFRYYRIGDDVPFLTARRES